MSAEHRRGRTQYYIHKDIYIKNDDCQIVIYSVINSFNRIDFVLLVYLLYIEKKNIFCAPYKKSIDTT